MIALYCTHNELEILHNLLADEKDNFALTPTERDDARNLYYKVREAYLR